jgi:hypothetical protein
MQTIDLGSLPSISELYVTALPGFKSTNNSTCCMLTSSQTIQISMDPHGICVLVSECSMSVDQTQHLKTFFSSPVSSPFSSAVCHTRFVLFKGLTEQNTIIVCYLKLVRILMWYSVYNW